MASRSSLTPQARHLDHDELVVVSDAGVAAVAVVGDALGLFGDREVGLELE